MVPGNGYNLSKLLKSLTDKSCASTSLTARDFALNRVSPSKACSLSY